MASYERNITDKYPETFAEAKPIYLAIKSWMERSHKYFSKDNNPTDYSIYADTMAKNYTGLALHMHLQDKSSSCKLYKRAIVLFEDMLAKKTGMLSRRIYWSKLGEAYSSMLEWKVELFQEANHTSKDKSAALRKIEHLREKAVEHYTNSVSNTLNSCDLILANFELSAVYMKMFKLDSTDIDHARKVVSYSKEMERHYLAADVSTQMQLQREIRNCRNSILLFSMVIFDLEKESKRK